jgi:hypothetical protein
VFSGSTDPPFTQRASIVAPTFPNLLATFDPNHVLYQLQTLDYQLQTPYALQFNASIQRSLGRDWVVSVGYAGARGIHLFRVGDANLAPSTVVNGIKIYHPELGRRNPNFGSAAQRITDAQSFYKRSASQCAETARARLARSGVLHFFESNRRLHPGAARAP